MPEPRTFHFDCTFRVKLGVEADDQDAATKVLSAYGWEFIQRWRGYTDVTRCEFDLELLDPASD